MLAATTHPARHSSVHMHVPQRETPDNTQAELLRSLSPMRCSRAGGSNENDNNHPPRPGSALSEGSPSPAQAELDLLEMCRRAAAKLSIDWPSQPTGQGAERDLYDGKRLPSRAPPVKQLIPAVPACVSEMKRFWDKPFSHRVPVKGFSRLDVDKMEELGMSNSPPVELSVAHHPAP